MRLTVVLALLAVVATQAAAASPLVPGVERNGPHSTLGWFDPATLRRTGPRVELGFHIGSWSISPARSGLAIAGGRASLRFVDLAGRRVAGTIDLAAPAAGKGVGGVTWLRHDRLHAFVRGKDSTTLLTIDPVRRKVLSRQVVPGVVGAVGRWPGGLVLRLSGVRLAVVDAAGTVHIRKLWIGRDTVHGGLAADPRGTAYLVGPGRVAAIDLRTLTVTYRSPPRQLAKSPGGPTRTVSWFGGGCFAVAGDGYGLKLVDVRTWVALPLPRA